MYIILSLLSEAIKLQYILIGNSFEVLQLHPLLSVFFSLMLGTMCMRRLLCTMLSSSPVLPACHPSNQCLTDTSLFFSSLLCYCLPLFSGMFCLVGFLQGGIEDTEMFYILQMTCDHNCTAEGSCCDLLIGCADLRDHPTLSVSGACWLWLNCIVQLDWCCATLFLLNLWPDLESHEAQENLLSLPCVNYSSILYTVVCLILESHTYTT